ncbi:hypothetical protein HZB60_06780 [candidate division KSB1 bacterium]|nr:hypothetical protein [candidate division KSB1 bacterium]
MNLKPRLAYGYLWIAAALYCLQYVRCLWIPPSYDDWGMIELVRTQSAGVGFIEGLWRVFVAPLGMFWRPFHVLPFVLVSGESLVWVQLSKLIAVVVLGFAMARCAESFGFSATAASLTGADLLLHQSQVLGGEPDLMGDVLCSLAVVMAVHLSARFDGCKLRLCPYWIGVAAITAMACLGKEAGVVVPLIPAAFVIVGTRRGPLRQVTRGHLTAAVSAAVAVILYLLIRFVLQELPFIADSSHVDYRFSLGLNIPRNVALMFGALACPVSTIRVFVEGGWILGLAVSLTLLIALLAGCGIWRAYLAGRGRQIAILTILFIAVQGPSLLFAHVNERNLTRSLSLGILLLAIAANALWSDASKRRRALLIGLFGVWLGLSQAAMAEKAVAIVRMHERASRFMDQVQQLMPRPPDRTVIFAAEDAPPGYSEYDQPFWQHLPGTCDVGLRYRYGEPGFRADFYVVSSLDSISDGRPDPDFWVSVDGLVKVPPRGDKQE